MGQGGVALRRGVTLGGEAVVRAGRHWRNDATTALFLGSRGDDTTISRCASCCRVRVRVRVRVGVRVVIGGVVGGCVGEDCLKVGEVVELVAAKVARVVPSKLGGEVGGGGEDGICGGNGGVSKVFVFKEDHV